MPNPIPIAEVNSGCANGAAIPRAMNTTLVAVSAPAGPDSSRLSTYARPKYRMFSMNAKPRPTSPANTTPSTMPSNSRRRSSMISRITAPLAPSSTHGATNTALTSTPDPPPASISRRLHDGRAVPVSGTTSGVDESQAGRVQDHGDQCGHLCAPGQAEHEQARRFGLVPVDPQHDCQRRQHRDHGEAQSDEYPAEADLVADDQEQCDPDQHHDGTEDECREPSPRWIRPRGRPGSGCGKHLGRGENRRCRGRPVRAHVWMVAIEARPNSKQLADHQPAPPQPPVGQVGPVGPAPGRPDWPGWPGGRGGRVAGRWRRPVAKAGGDGQWRMPVATAGGDGQWHRPVAKAGGQVVAKAGPNGMSEWLLENDPQDPVVARLRERVLGAAVEVARGQPQRPVRRGLDRAQPSVLPGEESLRLAGPVTVERNPPEPGTA